METKQNLQNNFNEVEYLTDVAKIRHEIYGLLQKYSMVNKLIPQSKAVEVNSYYGRITPNGAFGLEFSYGYPQSIYTPYGKVRIGIPFMNNNLGSYIDQKKFFQDMKNLFGITEVEPAFEKENLGKFGPYYAITRLPWKEDEKLPRAFKRAINASKTSSEVKQEAKRVNAFLSQAMAVLQELAMNEKKAKCLIGNTKVKTNETGMGL